MNLNKLSLRDFRNYVNLDLEFDAGVNLIVGQNAQGKTNLLEAIGYLGSGKSFRAQRTAEMIRFGAEGFRISIEYETLDGVETLEYACFGRERRRLKNGYRLKSASEMVGSFKSVLFYPDNLGLVKGGPDERRAFLNIAVAQCFPVYLAEYQRYKTALENRNSILKSASKEPYSTVPENIVCIARSRQLSALFSSNFSYSSSVVKGLCKL